MKLRNPNDAFYNMGIERVRDSWPQKICNSVEMFMGQFSQSF